MNFKSIIKNKKPINWDYTIVLEDLMVDPKALEVHKQRIKTVFANQSEEQQAQQLHNIVVRENLFNKAMNYLADFYEIEVDETDVSELAPKLARAFGEEKKDKYDEIARKVIAKSLIFSDIQKEFNIEISDDELEKILESYYEETNMSIRDFKENKTQWEAAKTTLLEEKTTAFIVDKFDRDLTTLEKNIRKRLAKEMKIEEHLNQSKEDKKQGE